jgi:hypothetical protein
VTTQSLTFIAVLADVADGADTFVLVERQLHTGSAVVARVRITTIHDYVGSNSKH